MGQRMKVWIFFYIEKCLLLHQTLIDECGSETLKKTHAVVYLRFRQQLINSGFSCAERASNRQQRGHLLTSSDTRQMAPASLHLSLVMADITRTPHTWSGAVQLSGEMGRSLDIILSYLFYSFGIEDF